MKPGAGDRADAEPSSGFARDVFADAKHWMYLILKAQSRNNAGTVTLRSTNPLERPQITFNSLAIGGDQDVQAVMDAVAFGMDPRNNPMMTNRLTLRSFL